MARQQPWYKLRHLEQYWIYSEHHSKNWPQENGINAIAHNSLYLCGRQNNRSLFWPHVWAGNWNCQQRCSRPMSTYSTLRIGTLCQQEKVVGDRTLPMMPWKWSDVQEWGFVSNFLQEKRFLFFWFFCRKELSAGGPFWLVTLAKPYCN